MVIRVTLNGFGIQLDSFFIVLGFECLAAFVFVLGSLLAHQKSNKDI